MRMPHGMPKTGLEDHVAEAGDQEDLGGLLACTDLAAGKQRERDANDGEGGEGGLDDNARPQVLEQTRERANEDALKDGVTKDQRNRRFLFEAVDEAKDEADDDANP